MLAKAKLCENLMNERRVEGVTLPRNHKPAAFRKIFSLCWSLSLCVCKCVGVYVCVHIEVGLPRLKVVVYSTCRIYMTGLLTGCMFVQIFSRF